MFIAVAGDEVAFAVYGKLALQADTGDETFTDNLDELQSGSPTRDADWAIEALDIDLYIAEIFFPVQTPNAEDSRAMAMMGHPTVLPFGGEAIIVVTSQEVPDDGGFDLIDLIDYSSFEPKPYDGPHCVEIIHVGSRI
jgi:hypothetical protein